jgi:hypothetical protein
MWDFAGYVSNRMKPTQIFVIDKRIQDLEIEASGISSAAE